MILTKLFDQKFFNTFGVISMSFTGWFILYLLSHYFSHKELGSYSLALAIVSPLALFFQFQLRNYYNSHSELENIEEFYKLRLYGSAIFLGVTIAASFLTNKLLMVSIVLISIFKFWEMLSEFSFAQKQKENKIMYIGLSQMVRATLIISTAFLISIYEKDYQSLLLSIAFIYFICSIADLKNANINLFKFKNNSQTFPYKSLLPLSLSALLMSFNINIPKYLLEFLMGTKVVGIFTTLFVFYNLTMVVSNSIIQVWINKFSKDANSFKQHKKNIINSFLVICLISIIFIMTNSLFGKFIYQIIFPETLHKYASFIIHLNYLIPLGLVATLTNYKLISQNNYKELFTNQVILIIFHLILSSIFIERYQLAGGFIGFSMVLVLHTVLNSRIILKRLRSLQ